MKKKRLNKSDLKKNLKISDPFLMIDKIFDIKIGKSGEGIKEISKDEWFYKCHKVNNPIMPGVLQVEAMLQTIIGVVIQDNKLKNSECLIYKINSTFYSVINKPGKIKIKAKIISLNKNYVEAKAIVYFNKIKKSEGLFKFFNKKTQNNENKSKKN